MNLEAIIQGCLDGKEGYWNMLVDLFSKKVFNLAYQFSGSYQEAQDLTQDIFVKLFHTLPRYESGRNFSAWLTTLAKNHLIDEYRRTKWEKTQRDDFDERVLAQPGALGPEQGMEQKEAQALVWEGLNHLSSEMRMVVVLRDLQGKSYDEMVEILGVPLGTVKSRVNRARLQLAEVLREKKGASS